MCGLSSNTATSLAEEEACIVDRCGESKNGSKLDRKDEQRADSHSSSTYHLSTYLEICIVKTEVKANGTGSVIYLDNLEKYDYNNLVGWLSEVASCVPGSTYVEKDRELATMMILDTTYEI